MNHKLVRELMILVILYTTFIAFPFNCFITVMLRRIEDMLMPF